MSQKIRHDQIRTILIEPHVSEKTTLLNQENGQIFTFTLSDEVVIRSPINKKLLHEPGGVLWDPINKLYLVTDTDLGEIKIYKEKIKENHTPNQ